MRKILAIALLMAGTAAFAYAGKGFSCQPHKDMVKEIIGVKGQGFLATAVTHQGLVLQFFLNRAGEFSVIGIDDQELSCVLLSGHDWAFAVERGT